MIMGSVIRSTTLLTIVISVKRTQITSLLLSHHLNKLNFLHLVFTLPYLTIRSDNIGNFCHFGQLYLYKLEINSHDQSAKCCTTIGNVYT